MKTYMGALITLVAIFIVHSLAIVGDWYIRYYPLDTFMHGVTGLGVGFFAYAFLRSLFPRAPLVRVLAVVAVLIVGIGWEVIEVVADISGHPFGTSLYYLDTVKDLAMDTIGGIVAVYAVFGFGKSSVSPALVRKPGL